MQSMQPAVHRRRPDAQARETLRGIADAGGVHLEDVDLASGCARHGDRMRPYAIAAAETNSISTATNATHRIAPPATGCL